MLQRLIAALLGVLGLIAIGLAIASATVWRGDDTLTATARAADGSTLITTAPGVLEMGDPPVTIRATADDDAKVVLAIGRDSDVAGWIGADAHTVITGLRDWHTFATDDVAPSAEAPDAQDAPEEDTSEEAPTDETPAGEAPAEEAPAEVAPAEEAPAEEAPAEEAPADGAATDGAPTDADATDATTQAPDPDGSDLWIEQVTGEGSAEMVWEPQDGRWTLLVASAGEGAGPPTIELSWPRTVTTPWLVPGVVGGAVLLLLALLLALRARRSRRRATTPAVPAGARPGDDDAVVGTRPGTGGATAMTVPATAPDATAPDPTARDTHDGSGRDEPSPDASGADATDATDREDR
ncbi:hypothetical protein [Cellulomonas sp. ATA003]|uniref:hypothetical protein n=1 Tax=Cellulomonas sp. ATA003 TaxID=3073064 RepID=UPI002873E693|nr:hypothetical protein [Cellulomonas sp. ATA003]WNB84942.1 hypothetical protein REH70_14725 [Cellulomonas sp. ATA003]